MTATARLDDIELSLASPMRTYKENATEDAPLLVAALRAVLHLHNERKVYPLTEQGDSVDLDAEPLATYCEECTPQDTLDTIEDCTWDSGYELVGYPCPTVSAVDAALGGAR
jgi:hypothetical protein